MVRAADILVLSTHNNLIVREWCSRVIWLDQGRIHADGPAAEILDQYAGMYRFPLKHEACINS